MRAEERGCESRRRCEGKKCKKIKRTIKLRWMLGEGYKWDGRRKKNKYRKREIKEKLQIRVGIEGRGEYKENVRG